MNFMLLLFIDVSILTFAEKIFFIFIRKL